MSVGLVLCAAGRTYTELLLSDDGLVMVGQAWEGFSSAKSLGAHPPSLTHVYVEDVDALHKRARHAGADVSDLEMSPAGDRRFTATDLEGQVWVFAQRVIEGAIEDEDRRGVARR